MRSKFILCAALLLTAGSALSAGESQESDIEWLKRAVADQQRQIDQLKRELADQRQGSQNVVALPAVATPAVGLTERVERAENAIGGLGGFRFSGDFLYLFDLQARSGNALAVPLQNARSRYRVRLNVDKNLSRQMQFHLQLSTGPLNNQITTTQDFTGLGLKGLFSIAEAWVAWQPDKHFAFRVGRMEEAFHDNSRFLLDDNLRLDGFEESARVSLGGGRLFNNLEFRAGEYILTNPNITILSAGSPLVAAGYKPGTRVGAANLFHPGVILRGALNDNWSHRATLGMQIYRNANQIQLSSVTAVPGESDAAGVLLSSPFGGAGNATTTPGGARYTAAGFQVAHLGYRLDVNSLLRLHHKAVPAFFDVQVSRNVATHKLRDAVMATASLGAIRKFGDVRGLYQFSIKDANSMISQFTDDDLGTATGVNLAVHGMRLDVGLSRFLTWSNILWIQDEKSPSNPLERFYVPVPRGANTTFRYFGQFAFVF